ncbi:MAG: polysaccharide biosynthesis tyrosine autokinase [Acidobacteriota bacterium]|nr:polysaccharide biosynthesis tyrosine autokinase [Acidobacteriota bacterium]
MREDNLTTSVPAVIPADGRRVASAIPYAVPQPYFQEPESDTPTVPLSHYLWIIKRYRWRILAFIATCVLATFIISKRLTPIYESTATVDVDRQAPQGVMGQDSQRNTPNDADQFLATQVKLIQSDAVLRPVAEKYKLLEEEKQLPADRTKSANVQEAPILLKKLKIARPPNTYLLLISYRSPNPQLAADAANAIADSYIMNTWNIRLKASAGLSKFMEAQLEELKAKMEKSSAALVQFEREFGVVNPEEKTSILSSRLLQLNTEYTNAQADRVRKEAAYGSIKSGSLESAQVSAQGEALKKINERLNEAQEKFADIKTRFGVNHPEYKKTAALVTELQSQLNGAKVNAGGRVEVEYNEASERERMLRKSVNDTKAEFDRVNSRSSQYQTVKREAEADRKFYEELLRKIKEAGINSGFQNSSIRLADSARPGRDPVSPNVKLNLLLAFLFSTILAVGGAVVSDMLDNTIRDPDYIKRALNTEVLGMLPEVKAKRVAAASIAGNGHATNGSLALMSLSDAADQRTSGYVEAMRTLRNSILLSNMDTHIHSMLVTSASPREGKTTTAVHLALAHAEQHHKTLLIDCDLRRPSVHKYFDMDNEKGMTTVITENLPWQQALVNNPAVPDLDILPSGPVSRRAADLVGRPMSQILEEAAKIYDLVVVDAPPMLGFAESLQLSTLVDGVVVVAHAGETSRNAVASVLSTLTRVNANVIGVVMNKMVGSLSDGYYYYGYYGKYGKDQYYYYHPEAKA